MKKRGYILLFTLLFLFLVSLFIGLLGFLAKTQQSNFDRFVSEQQQQLFIYSIRRSRSTKKHHESKDSFGTKVTYDQPTNH